MWISNRLYVGTGPDPDAERDLYQRDVVRVATSAQAARVIDAGGVAVVPTIDIARETLLLIGADSTWAWAATTGRFGAELEASFW